MLAVLAGLLPVVVAGALGATGRADLELVLPLERALDVGVALAALLVAVGWPFAALAPGARDAGLRGRGLELGLIAAGVAPGLRLAALLSAEGEAGVGRAFVGLAGLAAAETLWLTSLSRAHAHRSTGVVLGAAFAIGLPFVTACAREADLELPRLARGSTVVAALDALHGDGDPWGLVLGVVAAAAAVALGTRARRGPGSPASAPPSSIRSTPSGRAGAAVVLALVALFATTTKVNAQEKTAPLELVSVRSLLGPHDRPGELAPLRLELRAGPNGFEGEVGARGAGLLVLVPVKLAPLATGVFALPGVGDPSGSSLALEAWPRDGSPVPLEPAGGAFGASPVPVWAPLPGELEGTPPSLARMILHPRTARIVVSRGDLDLLGVAGTALDALSAPGAALRDPESRARLEAFVAGGGALALDDPAAVALLGEGRGAGPVTTTDDLVVRGLGAGVALAARRREGIAALGSELALRLSARALPLADTLADALTRAPEPRISPRVAGRIALQAALVAGFLGLVLVAQRRASASQLVGAFVVVALLLVAFVPRLVLGLARSPVLLETSAVLDAPSGGSVAGETQLLRFASPRSALARVGLAPGAPLAAVLPDEAEAGRSKAVLHWSRGARAGELRGARPASEASRDEVYGSPTLAPEPAALDFPLGRTPALFLRRTSRSLGGAVTLERQGRTLVVTNGLAVALEHPLVVEKEGIFELKTLAPGARDTVDLQLEPRPWKTLLAGEIARADSSDRVRWELLRAAFSPRARSGALRLTAFLALEPGRQTTEGVLEESAGPVVLIVRE